MHEKIKRINNTEWEIPKGFVENMRVSGRFFLSDLLAEGIEDGALTQLANVACLPGIIRHSYGMPDIHWGYGFPIGGVAAFDETEGIISPGGVGFDINCGVRMITTPLTEADLTDKQGLIEELFEAVPTGV
ncbi:MAG: RtcB family protein, partial [Methanocorpusculum sp.]|nr:RtcB family protein [Methanocorpusculum sp.]